MPRRSIRHASFQEPKSWPEETEELAPRDREVCGRNGCSIARKRSENSSKWVCQFMVMMVMSPTLANGFWFALLFRGPQNKIPKLYPKYSKGGRLEG